MGIGLCPGADAWSESEISRYLAKKGLKKSGDPLRSIDGYDQAENSQPNLGKINCGADGRWTGQADSRLDSLHLPQYFRPLWTTDTFDPCSRRWPSPC